MNAATNASRRRFCGIIPYLVTPLNEDESINVAELKHLSNHLIGQGVHGLTPLGSTGECAYLSIADRLAVVEAVVEASQKRVSVLPGVFSRSVKGAIEQAHAYEAIGANGIVLTLDSYFPLSPAAVKDYFMRVADATSLPIIIYTNPNFQKVDLSLDLIAELSQHPGFAGIKDASGKTGRLLSLSGRCRKEFDIFAASAHIGVAVMLLGGRGLFAGPACVLASENVRLYELCCSKRWDEAMALQKILWRFSEAFASYNLAACVKAALEHQGFHPGNPMAPQARLSTDVKRKIGKILEEVQADARPFLDSAEGAGCVAKVREPLS